MDTEPPDDGSMGGGNASEQDTRQATGAFLTKICSEKPHGPQQRETIWGHRNVLMFFEVSLCGNEDGEATTSWPSGRVKARTEDRGRTADTLWEGRWRERQTMSGQE